MPFRCFLPAWIAAWVIAIFLPSVVIAYLGISQAALNIGKGFDSLPASTWKVADDVGPAVKLMLGGFLLIGFIAFSRTDASKSGMRFLAGILIGLIAVLFTIGFIPASLSRGFAVALTGDRFSFTTTSIYLFGGVFAGLAFVISVDRCRGELASARKS